MNRRAFLSATAIAAAAPIFGMSDVAAAAQPKPALAPPKPSVLEQLASAAAENRRAIDFDGRTFSGAGFDWLLQRGSQAQAFLLGEEHGIAENPKLAAQLFKALVPSGYRHLAIEISPPMAAALDRALTRGPAAARTLLTTPESRVAFYGMREEAEFLSAARAALPRQPDMLWGLDYEIGADRHLIEQLKAVRKPAAANAALNRLADASRTSWAQYEKSRNPQLIYSFSGDPALVQAVRAAWPNADPRSQLILETLEQTFTINRLWFAKKGYDSNLQRSRFMRTNLLRYWQGEAVRNPPARLFMKFGASHMVRGLSMTDIFDIGSLVPELAAQRGGETFHMLVLPGPGTQTASLDPTQFRYVPGNRDQYGEGMELFDQAILPGKFTLFDTAPLRPLADSYRGGVPLPLWRVIHGFDAVLIMTGSTPSTNL